MRSRAHTTKMQIAHTINYRRVVTASSWCRPLLSYGMSVLLFCVSWCILNRYAICIKMFKYDNEIKCIRSRSPFGLLTGHTENETTAEANTHSHTNWLWLSWMKSTKSVCYWISNLMPTNRAILLVMYSITQLATYALCAWDLQIKCT